jgi:hypothetical protein
MIHYLYAIRLPVNDYAIAYIGVTRQKPRERFGKHCRNRRSHIGGVVQLCGRENVIFEVLAHGDTELIYDYEIQAIKRFNTRWPNGYNIAAGGVSCRNGLDELPSTRAKKSANVRKEKHPNWGKPAWNRGRSSSAETRAKQSAAKRGVKKPPRSPEHSAHLADALRGKSFPPERIANITAAQRRRRVREAAHG